VIPLVVFDKVVLVLHLTVGSEEREARAAVMAMVIACTRKLARQVEGLLHLLGGC
jgi:hypothetical protein